MNNILCRVKKQRLTKVTGKSKEIKCSRTTFCVWFLRKKLWKEKPSKQQLIVFVRCLCNQRKHKEQKVQTKGSYSVDEIWVYKHINQFLRKMKNKRKRIKTSWSWNEDNHQSTNKRFYRLEQKHLIKWLTNDQRWQKKRILKLIKNRNIYIYSWKPEKKPERRAFTHQNWQIWWMYELDLR